MAGDYRLHMRRIYARATGLPVFLLHGSIENGRIFYSENGKGYAPFLARAGYDVYVGDLRGRGKSTPSVQRGATYGQAEAMGIEIPAFLAEIQRRRGPVPLHLGAHSWGGVSLIGMLARSPGRWDVRSLVLFGSKRRISVRNWAYWWKIGFFWKTLGRLAIATKGYLPARELRMGADNISKNTFRQTDAWVCAADWKHWHDGFDYRAALSQVSLPPTYYLAGIRDDVLGHPKDVQLLAAETGDHQVREYHLLSKKSGQMHNYGHIDMLTHADAQNDHFPMALAWMQSHE